MNVVIREEPADVANRLEQLGLDEEELKDVVRQSHLAYISCTENHPPVARAIWAWGETVRALREYLLPRGWARSDEKNFPRVIAPSGMTIVVATGNDGTARPQASPSTKVPKGPSTFEAVMTNQLVLDFIAPAAPTTAVIDEDSGTTWILLVYRTPTEVRCELSLPTSISADGHIDGWRERILIGSIPFGDDGVEVVPPSQPDITIPVLRRA